LRGEKSVQSSLISTENFGKFCYQFSYFQNQAFSLGAGNFFNQASLFRADTFFFMIDKFDTQA
jgi:hypothetical protein